MEARMSRPTDVLPDAFHALLKVGKAARAAGLPEPIPTLVHLRASQVNGCSWCVDMHAKELRAAGESDERIFCVAAWREAPYYTDAERAALALTESVTRLADRPDPEPDEVWDEAARHFDEKALAGLLFEIATINVWNRLNVATRQVANYQHP